MGFGQSDHQIVRGEQGNEPAQYPAQAECTAQYPAQAGRPAAAEPPRLAEGFSAVRRGTNRRGPHQRHRGRSHRPAAGRTQALPARVRGCGRLRLYDQSSDPDLAGLHDAGLRPGAVQRPQRDPVHVDHHGRDRHCRHGPAGNRPQPHPCAHRHLVRTQAVAGSGDAQPGPGVARHRLRRAAVARPRHHSALPVEPGADRRPRHALGAAVRLHPHHAAPVARLAGTDRGAGAVRLCGPQRIPVARAPGRCQPALHRERAARRSGTAQRRSRAGHGHGGAVPQGLDGPPSGHDRPPARRRRLRRVHDRCIEVPSTVRPDRDPGSRRLSGAALRADAGRYDRRVDPSRPRARPGGAEYQRLVELRQ